MEVLKNIIAVFAYASLAISAAAAYLRVNKIWTRKHHPEVADSVSVAGNVILLVPLVFYGLHYMLNAQWQGVIDCIIWILAGVIFILIGSRFWVRGYRQKSFKARVKEVLKLERSEVGDLARAFFRPSAADTILEILARIAYIDRELAPREKAFIQSFADSWHVDFDWQKHHSLASQAQAQSLIETRDLVVEYLDTSPPREQVSQLIDVIKALARVDDTVAEEERLILAEIDGLLTNYLGQADARATYAVVIAPQSEAQDAAIAALLPHVRKTDIAGGSAYVIGAYFSQDYAGAVCDQYRALGYFTIDIAHAL